SIFLFFIMPRLQPKRNKATVAIHKSLGWLLTLYFVNFCLWIFPELLQGKCGYYQIDKVYPDYNTFLEYLDLAILPLSMVFASTMIMSRMPKPWIIPSILFPYMLYALNDIYGILPFKFYKFAYITTIIVVVVQLAWYAFFIKKFNKRLKDNYSDLDRRNIKWILLTLVPLSLLSILYIPLTMMSNVDELMIIYDLLTFLILSNIVGCALSYKVDDMTIELIDEQMDEMKKEKNQKVDVAASDNSKTQPSSNLSNKFLNFDEIFQKLEEECFYLDTEVNIDWISSKLGTNRHYVSDYLNRVKHVSFYEYVNTLRLIHAERLLKEGNEKMADIAFICGFNSDHTFRRLFKERYGCTPLQYQKSA
ncbi:MAG: helix-turn-helix transcriptional regulator, partial [Paludibacteraceae bacterium]|nr:helix-turn-helix transcriptional regulator [Paludibacteraceae bacterium]